MGSKMQIEKFEDKDDYVLTFHELKNFEAKGSFEIERTKICFKGYIESKGSKKSLEIKKALIGKMQFKFNGRNYHDFNSLLEQLVLECSEA